MKMVGVGNYLKLKVVLPLYIGLSIFSTPHNNLCLVNNFNDANFVKIVKEQITTNKKIFDEKSRKLRIRSIMPRSEKYLDSLFAYSKEYNVNPEDIAAIIQNESSWRYGVISKKGAIGLMQINSEYHKIKNPINPYENMRVGIKYFGELKTKYKKPEVSYAAYNAGPTRVDEWIFKGWNGDYKTIPYKETREYVKRINSTIDDLM